MDKQSNFTQQLEVAGRDLVDQVKRLADDAGAKRVILRHPDGHEIFALPLTWGVGAGAVAVIATPALAALAAVGGALANVRLEVERTDKPEAGQDAAPQDATIPQDPTTPQDPTL